MANELFRSPIKAKNKTVRIVSSPFENVIEFTRQIVSNVKA